jgi:hypothetical protein
MREACSLGNNAKLTAEPDAEGSVPGITVTLFLEHDQEPIRGWVASAPGRRRLFAGWLDFAGALAEVRALANAEPQRLRSEAPRKRA